MNSSPETLKQLVYSSVAQQAFTQQELEDILQISRQNNRRDQITGLLLYRNDCFIQVLEGPEQKVEQAYQRICRDSRHYEVFTLYDSPVLNRDFPQWAMAFNGDQSEPIEGLSDFLHPYKSEDESTISEGAVKQLLRRFREVNKR